MQLFEFCCHHKDAGAPEILYGHFFTVYKSVGAPEMLYKVNSFRLGIKDHQQLQE